MKFFTDIEQSKKLAEILPLESADMCYRAYREEGGIPDYLATLCPYQFASWIGVPCWSLAALLNVIPSGQVNFIRLPLNGENRYAIQVLCGEEWKIGDWKSNPIDACYEMIIKLHEEKLL